MKARSCALLVGVLTLIVAGCGDGGPTLPTQQKDWLVLFKRITVANDSPGRAEVEVEVRAGSSYSSNAPDGTVVVFRATLGQFVGGTDTIEASTHAGRATVTLVLPVQSRFQLTASAGDSVTEIVFIVLDDGSVQLGTS